jgi:hypothetical protein
MALSRSSCDQPRVKCCTNAPAGPKNGPESLSTRGTMRTANGRRLATTSFSTPCSLGPRAPRRRRRVLPPLSHQLARPRRLRLEHEEAAIQARKAGAILVGQQQLQRVGAKTGRKPIERLNQAHRLIAKRRVRINHHNKVKIVEQCRLEVQERGLGPCVESARGDNIIARRTLLVSKGITVSRGVSHRRQTGKVKEIGRLRQQRRIERGAGTEPNHRQIYCR